MSSTKHIGHQVIAMMDRVGVSPIARNYHLFYSCIANSNPAMRRAVRDLGMSPTQHELDRVIEEHCPEAAGSPMMGRHENAVLHAIDELTSRMRSEHLEMSSFQNAIERVSSALVRSAEQEKVTVDILMKVVGAIEQAGNRRSASSHRALERMSKQQNEVDALKNELLRVRKMANTDVLTGLANRRHFDERLATAVGQGSDLALLLLDIDNFKNINDTHGHPFGDYVLKAVTAAILGVMRAGAFVARTGGEEFAILVKKAKERDVMIVAERVRQAVENMKVRKREEEVQVTISVGVATSKSAQQADQIYGCADAALYRSKNAGRNRVTLHDPSTDESSGGRYRIYG
jgi:diguanylate cyclase